MLLSAVGMPRHCVPLLVGVSTLGEMGTTVNWDEEETRGARHQRRLTHCKTKVSSNCSVAHSSPWPSLTKATSTHGEMKRLIHIAQDVDKRHFRKCGSYFPLTYLIHVYMGSSVLVYK